MKRLGLLSPRPAARKGLLSLVPVLFWTLAPGGATALGIATESAGYLLIGTGSQSVIGTAAAVSNFELGANTSAVPMSGLSGSVPALPGNAATVFVGVGGNGDVALTHEDGNFNFSNLEIWGDTGADCAGSTASCNSGVSNTDFNGNPMSTSNGINGLVDLSGVFGELTQAKTDIPGLASTLTLDFSADGKWDTNLLINLLAGLSVIDIDTGGNDLLLENANLLFDGPVGAFAIVRVPDDANFTVSQANIIVGDGGIGLNNVLFYSDKPDNGQHFNFNDTILNGVAFWDLSMTGGEVSLNNAQGCTQLVGDKINLNDVRLNNCAFVVPEPSTGALLALGVSALAAASRSRRRASRAARPTQRRQRTRRTLPSSE